jgi:cytochrome b561
MLKSRLDRYGTVAVSIHRLSAVLILALLGSGFQAANAMDRGQRKVCYFLYANLDRS